MEKYKRFYTKTALSGVTGVSRQTLRRWQNSGKLIPLIDEKGNNYYLTSQVEKIINERAGEDDIVWNGDSWVNLVNIPKDNKGCLSWINAAERHAEVQYGKGDFTGIIKIQKYDKKTRTLSVILDSESKEIKASSLSRAMIKWLTGEISNEYNYSVGYRLKYGNTDITITKLTRSDNGKSKAYEFICNKCGQPGKINEGNISDKGSCSVCIGKIVVEGVNDIATTDSWMVPYFQDPNDAKKYYHGNKTAKFFLKCPNCERIKEKPMLIDTLYRTRSIGCRCGDGFSYPNKFMYSVCEQLLNAKVVDYFKDEYTARWLKRRRFDFYIEWKDKKIIVEMDGGFHNGKSRDKNKTPDELKQIDREKDRKAAEYGLQVIRIDATKSDKKYLKEKIINALSDYFPLTNIDWEKADNFAISNIAKEVCLYYAKQNEMTIEELAEAFHINKTTALRYVHRGEAVGWCTYNRKLMEKNKNAYARQEAKEREEREKAVCEYYDKHAPITANEIAIIFNIHHSTAIKYLKNCEKYGFKPYDRNYTKEIGIKKLKNAKRDALKKAVCCYSLDGIFIKKYESLTAAAEDNNVSITAISRCCKSNGTCSGRIFLFENG